MERYYTGTENGVLTVSWYFKQHPSIAEIVEAAHREFPSIPLEKLFLTTGGWDGETVVLTSVQTKPRHMT